MPYHWKAIIAKNREDLHQQIVCKIIKGSFKKLRLLKLPLFFSFQSKKNTHTRLKATTNNYLLNYTERCRS